MINQKIVLAGFFDLSIENLTIMSIKAA